MKTPVFLTFCMMIVTGLLSVHALFRDGLSPDKPLRVTITRLEKEKREAEFATQLSQDRLADYQQSVAALIPDSLKKKGSEPAAYPLRQLASVQLESDALVIERASSLMTRAKGEFREHEFEKAAGDFATVLKRYPDSVHAPEAHFLRAESLFQEHDFEGAIAMIDKMVDLYPDNELTGYALLRLANIFETQERLDDAADIYRAVLANFHQPEIIKQASGSLKTVAL